jgi:hypothetical protein
MNLTTAILIVLLTLLGTLLGHLATAYFKKKGENWATEEDLGKLTEIAKRIEAQVSGELWVQQEQYKRRQEFYARVIPLIHETLAIDYQLTDIATQILSGRMHFLELPAKAQEWVGLIEQNAKRVREAQVEAQAFGSPEVADALLTVSQRFEAMRTQLTPSGREEAFASLKEANASLHQYHAQLIDLLRQDLAKLPGKQ